MTQKTKLIRSFEIDLEQALLREKPLIQVMLGPRQVGKTTAARSIQKKWPGPTHYAAADVAPPPGPEWIISQWHQARRLCRDDGGPSGAVLLILDEVQKVNGWSEVVKGLWDEDRAAERSIQVIVLGSSALLLTHGTAESLSGRFFLHRARHWSYAECAQVFGWTLDQWIFWGGYPGAASLAQTDESAWRQYVSDSLIETVLLRDVLALGKVTKPVLLRHLFALATRYPAHVLSFNKMLGQLQDAGNTTTLAHYLQLLHQAFLVSGLERFSETPKSRGSSPKLIVWNNALINAMRLRTFSDARNDSAAWGWLVENAVGAHLLNHLSPNHFEICYWRHARYEVDFVVRVGDTLWAVEVKSGRPQRALGLQAFIKNYPRAKPLLIGTGGIPLETFFTDHPSKWFVE